MEVAPLYSKEEAYKTIRYFYTTIEKGGVITSVFLNDSTGKVIPYKYFVTLPPTGMLLLLPTEEFNFSFNICTTNELEEQYWRNIIFEESIEKTDGMKIVEQKQNETKGNSHEVRTKIIRYLVTSTVCIILFFIESAIVVAFDIDWNNIIGNTIVKRIEADADDVHFWVIVLQYGGVEYRPDI